MESDDYWGTVERCRRKLDGFSKLSTKHGVKTIIHIHSGSIGLNASSVIQVEGGGPWSIGLKSDNTILSWGDNAFGQLGDGSTIDRPTPVQISGIPLIKRVSAGEHHSLILSVDGTVLASGNNSSGQLGNGTTTTRLTPVQITEISSVAEIGAGVFHSLAVKSDGTAWSWGNNNYGQLGEGTTFNHTTPHQIPGFNAGD